MSQSQQSGQAPTKSGGDITRSAFLAKLPLLTRVVELCLAIIILGLIIDPVKAHLQHNVNHVGLTYTAFAGYILINCVIIISELVGEPLPKTPLLMFAFCGGVLFLAAGSLVCHDWRNLFYTMQFHPPKMYMDMMIASGVIAIFNSALYFADVVLTYRYASTWKEEAEREAATLEQERARRERAERERERLRGAAAGGSQDQQHHTDLADFAV